MDPPRRIKDEPKPQRTLIGAILTAGLLWVVVLGTGYPLVAAGMGTFGVIVGLALRVWTDVLHQSATQKLHKVPPWMARVGRRVNRATDQTMTDDQPSKLVRDGGKSKR